MSQQTETNDDKHINFSQIFQKMGESLAPIMEKLTETVKDVENIETSEDFGKIMHKYIKIQQDNSLESLIREYQDIQGRIKSLSEEESQEFWKRVYNIPESNNKIIDIISKLDNKLDDISVELQLLKTDLIN